MKRKFIRWLHESFLRLDTLAGLFVMLPWGLGFLYFARYDITNGYKYALYSAGVVILLKAINMIFDNPIKRGAKEMMLIDARLRDLEMGGK